MNNLLIALAGNPNSGKSTLFNALTGERQHVGNWPGKTVERKDGIFKYKDYEIKVVDLPGTYSLSAFSPEEVIARDFILSEKPDIVVTILDAANLERNLYLTVQVLELGFPVIVTLNMSDMAEKNGIYIDHVRLSQALKVPVVRMVASREEGIQTLIETIITTAEQQTHAH